MTRYQIDRLWRSFSVAGLLLGTLFFAASLTPSLLPRTFITQGILSGCSLAAGYGIGVFGRWLYDYLELPKPRVRTLWVTKLFAAAICVLIAGVYLWRASEWQNSIRYLMGLEPVDIVHPWKTGLIALLTFACLIVVARVFQLTFLFISRKLGQFIPRRVAHVVGIAIAVALFWSVINGVLFRFGLHAADASFQAVRLATPDLLHAVTHVRFAPQHEAIHSKGRHRGLGTKGTAPGKELPEPLRLPTCFWSTAIRWRRSC